MTSRDREWIIGWDMQEVAQNTAKSVSSLQGSGGDKGSLMSDDPEEFATVTASKEEISAFRKRVGKMATERLYDAAENSPMFIDGALLLFYVGMGAANSLYTLDQISNPQESLRNPISILQRLCLYPDIPSSTLGLFLGLGREFYQGAIQLLFEMNIDRGDPLVVDGNTATHLAVLASDLTPTHSRDEYFSEDALEKVKLLWQHGADFDNIENNDGLVPMDIAKMLAGKWDSKKEDPHNLLSDVAVKPRHILTPFTAQGVLDFLSASECGRSRPLPRFRELSAKQEDDIAVAIRRADWKMVQSRIQQEQKRDVKDTRWLVSSNNNLGLPLVWYFAAFMYNAAEHFAFSTGYVPIVEFNAMLDLYLFYPPAGMSRKEVEDDLRRLFWYAVGASFRFMNVFDKKEGLPINPFVSLAVRGEMQEPPVNDALGNQLNEAEKVKNDRADVEKRTKSNRIVEFDRQFNRLPQDKIKQIQWPYLNRTTELSELSNPASIFDLFVQLQITNLTSGRDSNVKYLFDLFSYSTLKKCIAFGQSLSPKKWIEKIDADQSWYYLNIGKSKQKSEWVSKIAENISTISRNLKAGIINERQYQSSDSNDDAVDDTETGAAASSSSSASTPSAETTTFNPTNAYARAFFAGIVHWEGFEKARTASDGFLKEKVRAETSYHISDQIHYAMRVGSPLILEQVRFAPNDHRSRHNQASPIQTAIAAGHDPSTIYQLHQSLQKLQKMPPS